MEALSPRFLKSEPEELRFYPDFLISRLMDSGLGMIEGNRIEGDPNHCQWTMKLRDGHEETVIREAQKTWEFRNVLARLALNCLDHNPYGDSSLFCVEHEGRTFRFRLYTCNEPTMDYWARLYLYSIETQPAGDDGGRFKIEVQGQTDFRKVPPES